ncbi:hypothetical protein H5410_061654 [Solanum commersonii]|uniref:Uncharacterized protein n=1 Tax=Solanum commersonii TaxID=4109 RepID=A0A9J5W9U8_SOLCO|nr:hypothetical protein H5410_061654 [Solanum commersonii]
MARMFGMAELQLRIDGHPFTDAEMEMMAERYPLSESEVFLCKIGPAFLEPLDDDEATAYEAMDDEEEDDVVEGWAEEEEKDVKKLTKCEDPRGWHTERRIAPAPKVLRVHKRRAERCLAPQCKGLDALPGVMEARHVPFLPTFSRF